MVIWLGTALNWRRLVYESRSWTYRQEGPIPSFWRCSWISSCRRRQSQWGELRSRSLYFVWELYIFCTFFFIGVFLCFGTDTSLLAAMSQVMGKYPSCRLEYRFCKHMVSMRRMFLVLFSKELCQQTVPFISVHLPLSRFPLVVTGFVNSHKLTKEYNGIFHFESFDDFLPCPVTHSLLASTPSIQYPFVNRSFSISSLT